MEAAKVNKLSCELIKMGVSHVIFTLLDNASTKTFGDSTTMKIPERQPEIETQIKDILNKAKNIRGGDQKEVFAASNVLIIGEKSSLGLPVSFISGGFYGPRGVLSDFEGGGGRIPKEYSRTDPGSSVQRSEEFHSGTGFKSNPGILGFFGTGLA